jgi:hypothetical protein
MIKWIVGSIVAMVLILWFCGVRAQQITIYTGPNGNYLGQAVVMSPTQPNPPIWTPNGR